MPLILLTIREEWDRLRSSFSVEMFNYALFVDVMMKVDVADIMNSLSMPMEKLGPFTCRWMISLPLALLIALYSLDLDYATLENALSLVHTVLLEDPERVAKQPYYSRLRT